MYGIYIMWGVMSLLFVALLLAMKGKEEKTAKRLESATDPMFRPGPRPRTAAAGAGPVPRGRSSAPQAGRRPARSAGGNRNADRARG